MIKDLKDGMSITDVFLVKDFTKRVTSAGLNYLTITLQDSSGVIDAKKWEIAANDLDIIKIGAIIKIRGEVLDYKNKLQIKVLSVEKVDSDDESLKNLLIESPVPKEILVQKFRNIYSSVKNPDCRAILDEIFKKYYDKFLDYPAAVKNHHEFYHGLIFHTVSMCEIADFIASHYEDINRDLLISGCILHDIGKVFELSGPVATKYTDEGNLLGHLTIGMSIVREAAEKLNIKSEVPMLLEHMILSHHGKLEFGAAVLPSTKEALLLSMIDDMDAKMMMLEKAYENVKEGEYTERLFALDNRAFYKSRD